MHPTFSRAPPRGSWRPSRFPVFGCFGQGTTLSRAVRALLRFSWSLSVSLLACARAVEVASVSRRWNSCAKEAKRKSATNRCAGESTYPFVTVEVVNRGSKIRLPRQGWGFHLRSSGERRSFCPWHASSRRRDPCP